MIRGIGIDIAQVTRMEEAVKRHGQRFLKRLFTATELDYCDRHRDPGRHYAARFAAKEATMKALGTGWNSAVAWKSIEVVNLPSGEPTLRLSGATLDIARGLGATTAFVTLSHDAGLAVACVVLEGPDAGAAPARGTPVEGVALPPSVGPEAAPGPGSRAAEGGPGGA
jgi:holo-[acyl-carrier protein] synthase